MNIKISGYLTLTCFIRLPLT